MSVGRLHDLLNNSPTAAWTVTTTAAPQITSNSFVRASIVVQVDAIFAQEGASCCTALGDLAAYIISFPIRRAAACEDVRFSCCSAAVRRHKAPRVWTFEVR